MYRITETWSWSILYVDVTFRLFAIVWPLFMPKSRSLQPVFHYRLFTPEMVTVMEEGFTNTHSSLCSNLIIPTWMLYIATQQTHRKAAVGPMFSQSVLQNTPNSSPWMSTELEWYIFLKSLLLHDKNLFTLQSPFCWWLKILRDILNSAFTNKWLETKNEKQKSFWNSVTLGPILLTRIVQH